MKFTIAITALFLLSAFGTQSPQVPVESAVYKFTSDMDISMKQYKKNGKLKEEQKMKFLLPKEGKSEFFGMELSMEEVEGASVVYDYGKEKMITLMDMGGMKQAVIIKMNKSLMEPDEETSAESIEFVNTGNTKTILGYTCSEYKANLEEGTYHYWVTQDAPYGIIEFFIRAQNQKAKQKMNGVLPQGQVLQVDMVDEKGEKMEMQVVSINENINKTIDLSNYQVIGNL